ncbi:MAG TPA: hypothetical protein VGQ35_08125 [Dongiaceae bacterium]|nr:hypothetical protein [Dongiaceae bacterium]
MLCFLVCSCTSRSGTGGEHLRAIGIDSTPIAPPHREALAIEIFQDLDRHLAPVLQPVAELGGAEPAALGIARDVHGNAGHFGDCLGEEEMIQRDLVHLAAPGRQAKHPPHYLLVDPKLARDITHARRAEPVELIEQGPRA